MSKDASIDRTSSTPAVLRGRRSISTRVPGTSRLDSAG